MRKAALAISAVWAVLIGGCGVTPETLMVTPVIYQDGGLDPFNHLADEHRTTTVPVFYATTRQQVFDGETMRYGNRLTESLQLGEAHVQFGDRMRWDDLHSMSRVDPRSRAILLELHRADELGTAPLKKIISTEGDRKTLADAEHTAHRFLAEVENHLRAAKDPEILIFVHGAKVNFYNSCVFAAELDHFTGRDMVTIAFSWPTHQDIFAYLSGEDVTRAYRSADAFACLLELLATQTSARRINILCWSAGGRVVARALQELDTWETDCGRDPTLLRIGTVVFAAPDVPVHEFVRELPEIDEVAEHTVITSSDDDEALILATKLMGGGERAGSSEAILEELGAKQGPGNVEFVDVSYGKGDRGFDITGHRYWFRHSWVASDMVLSLRTRLPAAQRGLEPGPADGIWYLPRDYPDRVQRAATEALGEDW